MRTHLAALALAGLWALWPLADRAAPQATLHVLDVGQGDALLLVSRRHAMLVDTGPPGAGVATRLPPLLGGANLDLVVATHADADHIGGLEDVLRVRPRASFREPGSSRSTGVWASLQAYLGPRRQGSAPGAERWWVGDVAATLISGPDSPLPGGDNNNGILVLLEIGPWRALLPGDAGAPREEQLLALGALEGHLPLHLLGLGHHGSATATTGRWLERLRPAAAFCSAGAGNRHGHPHPTTLDRLQSRSVRVDCTDAEGNLRYTFGPRLSITTDRHPLPATVAAAP